MGINYGDVLEAVARRRGAAPACTQGSITRSWSEFDTRSNQLARGLMERGIQPNDKICFFLFNSAAYLELLAACFKARFVHVNANYRYTSAELEYVLENSDSVVLVYDERLSDIVEALPSSLRDQLLLIYVGGASSVRNSISFEETLDAQLDASLGIERSPDDLIFVYTGGTTGMPKGVMWTQHEQARVLLTGMVPALATQPDTKEVIAALDGPKTYTRPLIASPLMHGLGLVTALTTLCNGGQIVLVDNAEAFDPHLHWKTIQDHSCDAIAIVGDAFAAPLLGALREQSYDLSSLRLIGSSGVMWSNEIKQDILSVLPHVTLFDSLASSEAMGLGNSVTTAEGGVAAAKFRISPDCAVFDEDWKRVEPGSGKAGRLARSGPLPLGYYKDDEKTAQTFPLIDGKRYSIPGDMCTVDADGTIHLLGRGSQCINTGGEKVFPEEVEQCLKSFEGIEDALVFGTNDPKWGQAVSAVITLNAGAEFKEDSLRTFLRQQLAGYKVPKRFVVSERALRLVNGKPDYKLARSIFDA